MRITFISTFEVLWIISRFFALLVLFFVMWFKEPLEVAVD